MDKNINIIDFYKSILDCGNLTTDKDGFVSVKESNSPVLVTGKQLVLPIEKQLTSGNWSEKIVFHPLSENILRGESDVITKLRLVFNIRLNYTFAAISQELLAIVASTVEHKNLNPQQNEILSAISEVDNTTLENFNKITMAAIGEGPDRAFINIFLKRGGLIHGKKHSRVGIVTFPFYEELKKEDQEVFFGVKLRVKDKLVFKQLYEYILPNLDVVENYNFGSDSNIAPFLHSLMGAVMNIGSKFNDVLELFSKEIDSSELLVFSDEWVSTFDVLPELIYQIRLIPMQQGNDGSVKLVENQTGVTQPQPVVQQPSQTLPYQNPQFTQQQPQPVYNQPQPHQPWMPQPISHPQQQQAPGLVVTRDGLDFNSVLRANPQVAAMVSHSGFQQNRTMQNFEPQPRWATQNQQPYPQPQQFGNPYQNTNYGRSIV